MKTGVVKASDVASSGRLDAEYHLHERRLLRMRVLEVLKRGGTLCEAEIVEAINKEYQHATAEEVALELHDLLQRDLVLLQKALHNVWSRKKA